MQQKINKMKESSLHLYMLPRLLLEPFIYDSIRSTSHLCFTFCLSSTHPSHLPVPSPPSNHHHHRSLSHFLCPSTIQRSRAAQGDDGVEEQSWLLLALISFVTPREENILSEKKYRNKEQIGGYMERRRAKNLARCPCQSNYGTPSINGGRGWTRVEESMVGWRNLINSPLGGHFCTSMCSGREARTWVIPPKWIIADEWRIVAQ